MRQQNMQARQDLKEIDDHLQQKKPSASPTMPPPVHQEPEKQVVSSNNEDTDWSFFDSL
jgi:hypothetical protein